MTRTDFYLQIAADTVAALLLELALGAVGYVLHFPWLVLFGAGAIGVGCYLRGQQYGEGRIFAQAWKRERVCRSLGRLAEAAFERPHYARFGRTFLLEIGEPALAEAWEAALAHYRKDPSARAASPSDAPSYWARWLYEQSVRSYYPEPTLDEVLLAMGELRAHPELRQASAAQVEARNGGRS